jgi:hypothetical protein
MCGGGHSFALRYSNHDLGRGEVHMAITIFAPQMPLFGGWYFLNPTTPALLSLIFGRIVTFPCHVYFWGCTVRFFYINLPFQLTASPDLADFRGDLSTDVSYPSLHRAHF